MSRQVGPHSPRCQLGPHHKNSGVRGVMKKMPLGVCYRIWSSQLARHWVLAERWRSEEWSCTSRSARTITLAGVTASRLISKGWCKAHSSISPLRLRGWKSILETSNAGKTGPDDKHCMIEARLEGRQPTAVTHIAATLDQAVKGAADKMKRSLESTLVGCVTIISQPVLHASTNTNGSICCRPPPSPTATIGVRG